MSERPGGSKDLKILISAFHKAKECEKISYLVDPSCEEWEAANRLNSQIISIGNRSIKIDIPQSTAGRDLESKVIFFRNL